MINPITIGSVKIIIDQSDQCAIFLIGIFNTQKLDVFALKTYGTLIVLYLFFPINSKNNTKMTSHRAARIDKSFGIVFVKQNLSSTKAFIYLNYLKGEFPFVKKLRLNF